jgi:hypothetical protein
MSGLGCLLLLLLLLGSGHGRTHTPNTTKTNGVTV